jgi:hypothetical protein
MTTCPHCGADLPTGAKACPECGSDEETGWSEQARHDGLDLPDDRFDYGEFVRNEFGGGPVKPRGLHWLWWGAGILLIGSFLFFWLRSLSG